MNRLPCIVMLLLPFAVSSQLGQPYYDGAGGGAIAVHFDSSDTVAANNRGKDKANQSRLVKQRKKVLDGFARTGRYIEYAPKSGKQHTLYVFTDVDCPYCRKLHANMGAINHLGMAVRYIPYPIIGNDVALMEKVWCSKDRRTALDQAMVGGRTHLKGVGSCSNPINRIIELGRKIKVSSTPAIYLEDGTWMPTTDDPNRMLRYLNRHQGRS